VHTFLTDAACAMGGLCATSLASLAVVSAIHPDYGNGYGPGIAVLAMVSSLSAVLFVLLFVARLGGAERSAK
jgi:hypothetical protein